MESTVERDAGRFDTRPVGTDSPPRTETAGDGVAGSRQQSTEGRARSLSRRAVLVRGIGLAGLVAVAGGTAACGGAAASAGAGVAADPRPKRSSASLEKLTITYGGTNAGALPLWLAEQLGYFHDEGLQVNLVNVPWNSGPLKQLNAGTARFVTISMDLLEWDTSCCTATGEHADAVYLAAAYAVPVFSLLAGHGVTSLSALRGKKVGVPGEPASAAHYGLLTALQANGLTLNDVVLVNGQDAKTYFQQLQQGTLAAAVLPPPMSIRSVQKGLRLLADCSTYRKPYPSAWLATDRHFAAQSRATVTRVVHAWLRGLQAARRSPSLAAAAIGHYGGVGQPKVALATYRAYAPLLLAKPYPPLAGVEAALGFLSTNYPHDAPALRRLQAASFVDTSFLRELKA